MDKTNRMKLQEQIKQYYHQILNGCGKENCENADCASSGKMTKVSPNQAAVLAFRLLKNGAKLCSQLITPDKCEPGSSSELHLEQTAEPMHVDEVAISSHLDNQSTTTVECASNLKIKEKSKSKSTTGLQALTLPGVTELVWKYKEENNFGVLRRVLGEAFSSWEVMAASFPPADGHPEDSDIFLGLEDTRKAFSVIFDDETVNSEVQTSILSNVKYLVENAELDLKYRSAYFKRRHYLNIFTLIMELPIFKELEFLHQNGPFASFCKALLCVPPPGKLKLAKFWSQQDPEWLLDKVQAIQQGITIQVVGNNFSRKHVQDDELVTNGVRVLFLLYCASMHGGTRENKEQLEMEKEFYLEEEEDFRKFLASAADSEGFPKPYRRSGTERAIFFGEEDSDEEEPPGSVTKWPGRANEAKWLMEELNLRVSEVLDPLVSHEEFYNESLCEVIEMDKDYLNLKMDSQGMVFSFLNYPFVLTPYMKMEGMYFDNRIQMMHERRAALFNALRGNFYDQPFLKLHVRRDHVVQDALASLELISQECPSDLKKQLRVVFDGEQGVDEGGVSKEFYQIITDQLFNPDYAMFVYNPETRLFWFNPLNRECNSEFTLIGILFGLAIYNSIIVDVNFPLVLYRKLQGKLGRLRDLEQLDPVLHRGLKDLLEYQEENLEEIFCYTFRISYKDVYGCEVCEDLKVEGDRIPVTKENRKEFVELYTDFLLNRSVRSQFAAFRRGFRMVTEESPLDKLFRAEEIEQLVCGTKFFDFEALQASTCYDNGYDEGSETIKNFWEVVHEMSEDEKKLLLQFSTGSDRVPVGGLAKMKFMIAKNGEDSDRLPTAHTCFNVLLLPEYSSKEKLKERLLKAITNSRGFGLQ